MSINDHDFEAAIKAIRITDNGTEIVLTLSPKSDDAFTMTTLIDFKKRGLVQFTAQSLQPAFNMDDKGWDIPQPPAAPTE